MKTPVQSKSLLKVSALSLALGLVLTSGVTLAGTMELKLSGIEEVPVVPTHGSGTGSITINDDGSVSGSVLARGFAPTAAHIHEGAAGTNGKVIIPFTKDGDKFSAPPGAKLTAEQMKAFEAGNLYVNIHSAEHPDGEIRA